MDQPQVALRGPSVSSRAGGGLVVTTSSPRSWPPRSSPGSSSTAGTTSTSRTARSAASSRRGTRSSTSASPPPPPGSSPATRTSSGATAARPATSTVGIPLRYPLAVAGIAVATIGLGGDLHSAFGEEAGVARGIAPFHLLLFAGAAALVAAPLRLAPGNGAHDHYPAAPSFLAILPPLR